MPQLTITLDDDLMTAAQAFAKRKGQSLEALVIQLLQAAMQQPAKVPLSPTRP